MKIIYNNVIPFKGFVAMTIGPLIFTRKGVFVGERLIRHESIHWAQQKELLILPFYILYILLWLWELIRCTFNLSRGASADGRHRSLWRRAYRSIAFEREAYEMQDYVGYLGARRHYAWIRVK